MTTAGGTASARDRSSPLIQRFDRRNESHVRLVLGGELHTLPRHEPGRSDHPFARHGVHADFFNTPPTLTAGGFIAGAIYDNSISGLGIGSATYSSNFGLQFFVPPTANGTRINNGAPENIATNVTFNTTGDTTFVGNAATILSLTVGNTTSTVSLDSATASGSLNLTGGGITVAAGNAGGVTFGPGAGAASVNLGSAGAINAQSDVTFNIPLAGTAGFTKSGEGLPPLRSPIRSPAA